MRADIVIYCDDVREGLKKTEGYQFLKFIGPYVVKHNKEVM